MPPTDLVGATIFSTSTRSRRGIKRLAIFIEARGAECSIDAIGGCFQRRRFISFSRGAATVISSCQRPRPDLVVFEQSTLAEIAPVGHPFQQALARPLEVKGASSPACVSQHPSTYKGASAPRAAPRCTTQRPARFASSVFAMRSGFSRAARRRRSWRRAHSRNAASRFDRAGMLARARASGSELAPPAARPCLRVLRYPSTFVADTRKP